MEAMGLSFSVTFPFVHFLHNYQCMVHRVHRAAALATLSPQRNPSTVSTPAAVTHKYRRKEAGLQMWRQRHERALGSRGQQE